MGHPSGFAPEVVVLVGGEAEDLAKELGEAAVLAAGVVVLAGVAAGVVLALAGVLAGAVGVVAGVATLLGVAAGVVTLGEDAVEDFTGAGACAGVTFTGGVDLTSLSFSSFSFSASYSVTISSDLLLLDEIFPFGCLRSLV